MNRGMGERTGAMTRAGGDRCPSPNLSARGTVRDGSYTFQEETAMNPSLESMLDPEHLAQPLPGAIYLAAPYTARDPAVEQARMQAVKHVSDRLIRQGQVVFSPLEYTEAMQQRGIVPPQGWYLFDLAMLRGCVKLLVLALPGWRESQGVIMETAAAKALGIPVEVLTVEEAGLPCDLERQLNGTA